MEELVKQRSMLMILIAACTNAHTAFQAADNVVDRQLLEDLTAMIARSEQELAKLNERIAASRSDGEAAGPPHLATLRAPHFELDEMGAQRPFFVKGTGCA